MMKKIGVIGICVAWGLCLTACVGAGVTTGTVSMSEKNQMEGGTNQVISVSSRESVKVAPDIATIVYGITTQNQDAVACQDENSKKMNQLIETLKKLGVDEASIQTSNYSLAPRQDWQNGGAITGYEMSAELTVTNVELDQVGALLTASVDAGVNRVQSITYLSSKYDESYQAALKQAVARAEEKAKALAEAGGVPLGQAVRITEYAENQTARYQTNVATVAKQESAARMAVDMMPGEISIEANVSVEYAIGVSNSTK